nr:MAG TPA: hypothetical protein [Caudoviricetes sp.]
MFSTFGVCCTIVAISLKTIHVAFIVAVNLV